MTTLITGAAGFVGLALTEALLTRGHTVVAYDLNAPPQAALRAFASLPGTLIAVQGDVTDKASLVKAMTDNAVSRVVAGAAITAAAARELTMADRILAVNTGGAIATVEAAIATGVQRMVYLSSGSIYGASGASFPVLAEATPARPESLYGITKLAGEQAVLRLATLGKLDLLVGRLGTCFGPWERDTGHRDTLSPPLQAFQAACSGNRAILPREGLRDWLYVRDTAAAIVALLDAPAPAHRHYNLSAGFEWSMAAWCGKLQAAFPDFRWHVAGPGETATIDYYAPYDRAPLAIERLLTDTDFVPAYNLDQAVADYLAWYATAGEVLAS